MPDKACEVGEFQIAPEVQDRENPIRGLLHQSLTHGGLAAADQAESCAAPHSFRKLT